MHLHWQKWNTKNKSIFHNLKGNVKSFTDRLNHFIFNNQIISFLLYIQTNSFFKARTYEWHSRDPSYFDINVSNV